MLSETFLYLIPYIIALLLSLVVGVIIWQRREVIGARTYAIVAFAHTSIVLGYILELASPTLEGKLLWDDFQWIGLLIWAYLFPIFSMQLTGSERVNKPATWWLFAIIPAIFTMVLLTNSLHGWVHHDAWLVYGNHFNSLRYEYTLLVWGFAIYGYLSMILSFGYLLVKYFKTHRIYRNQIGAVVIGAAIPLAGYALSLLEVTLSFQRDIAPLTMTLGNLVIYWGLTRQGLFDLLPIARDIIVDNMEDLVIVADAADRIVDLNKSARNQLHTEGRSIIGQDLRAFLVSLEENIVHMEDLQVEGQSEIILDLDGESNYIDMRVTRITDGGKDLGRVFVARNVTIQKKFEQELLDLNIELEQRVLDRTQDLEKAYEATLEGWAKALELRDKETEGHSRRVTELAVQLCKRLGFSPGEVMDMRRGALIHDIGKMGIPDEILHKPGPLTAEEWETMKQHPIIGYNLLAHIPFLEKALEVTFFHHERWNGTGYPEQLQGEQIPMPARIFAVIDHWDALLSDRPYRKAWSREQVIDYMKESRGEIFDPVILDAFFDLMGIKV